MKCPYCGSENEESKFCGNCGAPMEASAPQSPNPNPYENYAQQEPAQSTPQAPVIITPPMRKREYIKTIGSEKCKKFSLISTILTFVIIVAMFGGFIISMNTSIEELPFIVDSAEKSDTISIDEFVEMKKDLKVQVQNAREELEIKRDRLSASEIEFLEKLLDACEKMSEKTSIRNLNKFIDVLEDYADDKNALRLVGMEDDMDDVAEAAEIFSDFAGTLFVMALFTLVFTAFGGFFKVNGLVITGMILGIIFCTAFCPMWFYVIVLGLHIAIIVLLKKIKSEYKIYKLRTICAPAQVQ